MKRTFVISAIDYSPLEMSFAHRIKIAQDLMSEFDIIDKEKGFYVKDLDIVDKIKDSVDEINKPGDVYIPC